MSDRKRSGSDRTTTVSLNGESFKVRLADRPVIRRLVALAKLSIAQNPQGLEDGYTLAAELCPGATVEQIDALTPDEISLLLLASAGHTQLPGH